MNNKIVMMVVAAFVAVGLIFVIGKNMTGPKTDLVNELLRAPAPRADNSTQQPEQAWGPDYSNIKIEQVIVTDMVYGDGPAVLPDSVVDMLYTVWVYDPASPKNQGALIAKSDEKAYRVKLGKGNLLAGWEQGMQGMRLGGKRQLLIPHKLAYGEHGVSGKIPPKAVIMVEVEFKGAVN